MRSVLVLAIGGLFLIGCEKSPTKVAVPLSESKGAWIGSYTGTPEPGDLILDLARVGSAVTGAVVFGSTASGYARVAGSAVADSIFLTLDPAVSPTPLDFSLRAAVLADGGLSGTMKRPKSGLDATFSCRVLPRRTVDVDASHLSTIPVLAMAYDGSDLWLSSVPDYVRVSADGVPIDTIEVEHGTGVHWTSSVLLFDGSRLWGAYPITIPGPGGSVSVADLLGFDEGGRTPDSLRIGHRPVGLAFDGTGMWSLRSGPAALIRFDGAGAVLDSIPVGIPDADYLDYDGTHFWTLGFQLQRLYEVDANGDVLAICDLPDRVPNSLPTGLAVEGSHLWVAESSLSATALHRLTPR